MCLGDLWTPTESRWDVYKPRQRLIWSYYNGERLVQADPLVLWKQIMAVAPALDIDFKVSQSVSRNAETAHKALVQRIRDIFHIKSLENDFEVVNTLTDAECIDLLNKFLSYCGWVKKNSSNSVTTATATSPPTDSPTSAGESPPTSNTSVSGCADPAPPTAEPTVSQPESNSDSEAIPVQPTGVM